MKYEIYIKGCWDKKSNSVSFAFIATSNGTAIEKRAAKFSNEIILRTGTICVLPNKGQYQAELCALAWSLFYIGNDDAEFVVYSNNQSVVGWLNGDYCPEDYEDLFLVCKKLARGRKVTSQWIPKTDGNEWNVLMNQSALELLGMGGKSVMKII